MATIYKTNGEALEVSPKNGKAFSLEEMQEIVGGYIHPIRMKNGCIMIVNDSDDEDLEMNMKASEALEWLDLIVNDALVCTINEIQPYKQTKKKANPNDMVTITCYRQTEKMTRKAAIKKYHAGMLCCEGSERERYSIIYNRLLSGKLEINDQY